MRTATTITAKASASEAGPSPGGRPGWGPLVVIASAHLMAILDTTVMFVALPSAQRALGLSVTTRQWVVTAYTLAFAALLLLGGRLADRFGARRTLLVGVTGFACASAIGGASFDGTMLIAARAVQGAFAALLVSSTKSLLISVYVEARDRARAIGIFTATLTAGLAVGLVLGGVVTTVLGWRWCLYVNIPLSMVAIIGAPRVLPAVRERREVRIDTASAVMATVGMVALVYGLSEVPSLGWTAAEVVGCLATAAAVLGAFVARQATTAHPLLPIRVVLDRNRAGGLVAMVFNGLSTFGMLLILTYQLQAVMRYSPLRTGYALVPFAVAAALGSAVLAPRLAARVSPRWQIVAGLLLERGRPGTPRRPHRLEPLRAVDLVRRACGRARYRSRRAADPSNLAAGRASRRCRSGIRGLQHRWPARLVARCRPAQHDRGQRHRSLSGFPHRGEFGQRDGARLRGGHALGGGNSADRHGARRSSRQGQDAHSHGLTRQAGLRPTWGELCAFKAYNSPQVGEGPSRGRPKPGMARAGKGPRREGPKLGRGRL